jgi:ring-1,2-phenylacetyl-CoA epoxidase subunit PaaA
MTAVAMTVERRKVDGHDVDVFDFERPFEPTDKLDPEYRDLILRLLRVQADLESYLLFEDYLHPFLALAPTPIDKMRFAQLYAEEFGHAYQFWKMLADLDVVLTASDFAHRKSQYVFDDGYVIGAQDWVEVAVINTLTDRVGVFELGEWTDSSYGPMRRVAPGQVNEERGHTSLGYQNLKKVCSSKEGMARANELLVKWWPAALDMFGRSESTRQWSYIKWGLRSHTNAGLREQYLKETRPLLEDIGCEIPDDHANRRFL